MVGVKVFKVVVVFRSGFEGNWEGMDMVWVVGNSDWVVVVDQGKSKIQLLALGSKIDV